MEENKNEIMFSMNDVIYGDSESNENLKNNKYNVMIICKRQYFSI